MKKLLIIAMSVMLLTSCDFRQSSIPADWVGSWFSADGGWQCSLYEQVALYNNDVWQYQTVTKTDSSLSLTIANNGREVNLDFTGKNGDLGLLIAKYSVDGELIGYVLKNWQLPAADLCRKFDSAISINPPKRTAPKNIQPDGNVGTAVVRLYLRNDYRSFESLSNLGLYKSDFCEVVFNNRLETSQRQMQLVETDKFGKMFEATIPVDGIADFQFNRNNQAYHQDYMTSDFYYKGTIKYIATEGDTIMVVINHRSSQLFANQFSFMDANYFEGCKMWSGEILSSNADSVQTDDEFWELAQAFIDKAMSRYAALDTTAYALYKSQLQKQLEYQVGYVALNRIRKKHAKGETVSDDFKNHMLELCPLTDSCVLRTKESVWYAAMYARMFGSELLRTGNFADESTLHDDAVKAGFSPFVVDVLTARNILAKSHISDYTCFREELVSDEWDKGQLATISTPGLRQYVEPQYNDFVRCRDMINRAKTVKNLTDEDFAEFERLTHKAFANVLRDIQEGRTNVDVPSPRYDFMTEKGYAFKFNQKTGQPEKYPTTAYLLEKDGVNESFVVDSAYSSGGYFVFGNLKNGKDYAILYDGDTVASFQVRSDDYYEWQYRPFSINVIN